MEIFNTILKIFYENIENKIICWRLWINLRCRWMLSWALIILNVLLIMYPRVCCHIEVFYFLCFLWWAMPLFIFILLNIIPSFISLLLSFDFFNLRLILSWPLDILRFILVVHHSFILWFFFWKFNSKFVINLLLS